MQNSLQPLVRMTGRDTGSLADFGYEDINTASDGDDGNDVVTSPDGGAGALGKAVNDLVFEMRRVI